MKTLRAAENTDAWDDVAAAAAPGLLAERARKKREQGALQALSKADSANAPQLTPRRRGGADDAHGGDPIVSPRQGYTA